MPSALTYVRGKSLPDLAQAGVQDGLGINVGYNGQNPNPNAMTKDNTLGGAVGVPGALMGGFPVSLDDLKQWYYGITSGNTWQRAADQLNIAKNAVSTAVQPSIEPTHGQPITGGGMNLNDVWQKVASTIGLGQKNLSGTGK